MSHNGGNPIWMCLKVWKPPNPFKKSTFPSKIATKGRKIFHPQSSAGKSRKMELWVGNSKLKTAGIFQPRGWRESFPHVQATDSSNAQHLIESLGPWIGAKPPTVKWKKRVSQPCGISEWVIWGFPQSWVYHGVPLNPRRIFHKLWKPPYQWCPMFILDPPKLEMKSGAFRGTHKNPQESSWDSAQSSGFMKLLATHKRL